MIEAVNILFGATSYNEDAPAQRREFWYFSLLDDTPCMREVIIGRISSIDESKAAYIIDYIQSNTDRFKDSKSVILFFRKALEYHYDAEKYGKSNGVAIGARFDVLRRDKYKCRICGRSAKDGVSLEVDHIIPRSFGGGDEPGNLQTTCFDCNRGRSNKRLFEQ